MSKILRYDSETGIEIEACDGELVRFADHVSALSAKDAEIKELRAINSEKAKAIDGLSAIVFGSKMRTEPKDAEIAAKGDVIRELTEKLAFSDRCYESLKKEIPDFEERYTRTLNYENDMEFASRRLADAKVRVKVLEDACRRAKAEIKHGLSDPEYYGDLSAIGILDAALAASERTP